MDNNKSPKQPTEKQKIGKIGEDCACEYLHKAGYKILERNYLKKWGEIDIITQKGKKIHFIEVKSVSREISASKDGSVIRETPLLEQKSVRGGLDDSYRPEDNMHPWKLQRLGRAVQSYLLDRNVSDEVDWQFDVATVYIDINKRMSRVFLLEDIVL